MLGHKDEPGVDIISVIRKYGLPERFQVMEEAEAVPDVEVRRIGGPYGICATNELLRSMAQMLRIWMMR